MLGTPQGGNVDFPHVTGLSSSKNGKDGSQYRQPGSRGGSGGSGDSNANNNAAAGSGSAA